MDVSPPASITCPVSVRHAPEKARQSLPDAGGHPDPTYPRAPLSPDRDHPVVNTVCHPQAGAIRNDVPPTRSREFRITRVQNIQFVSIHIFRICTKNFTKFFPKLPAQSACLLRPWRGVCAASPSQIPVAATSSLHLDPQRRRVRFWRDDHRTCGSKSPRESDRDTVEREVGLSGGQGPSAKMALYGVHVRAGGVGRQVGSSITVWRVWTYSAGERSARGLPKSIIQRSRHCRHLTPARSRSRLRAKDSR